MSKADNFASLREAGYTHREIAEKCGCSQQYVSTMLARQNVKIFRKHTKKQVIFDGLRKWMDDNCVSSAELYRRMHGKNCIGTSANAFYGKLRGKNEFWMREINGIIRVTGLSYEELFLKEET